jgi:hypothetical protein
MAVPVISAKGFKLTRFMGLPLAIIALSLLPVAWPRETHKQRVLQLVEGPLSESGQFERAAAEQGPYRSGATPLVTAAEKPAQQQVALEMDNAMLFGQNGDSNGTALWSADDARRYGLSGDETETKPIKIGATSSWGGAGGIIGLERCPLAAAEDGVTPFAAHRSLLACLNNVFSYPCPGTLNSLLDPIPGDPIPPLSPEQAAAMPALLSMRQGISTVRCSAGGGIGLGCLGPQAG